MQTCLLDQMVRFYTADLLYDIHVSLFMKASTHQPPYYIERYSDFAIIIVFL